MQNNEDMVINTFQMAKILPLEDIRLPPDPEDSFAGLEDTMAFFLAFC